MKKILITSLLLVGLAVPSLAWAQEETASRPEVKLEPLTGQIVSLSVDTLNVATTEAEQVKVQITEKPYLRGLLGRGLGQKAQLLCRKTDKGALVLVRIKSIEGVELTDQRCRPGECRKRPRDRGQRLGPEEFGGTENRFKAMIEHLRQKPELRKELRELAEENPEAFRQRVRQMHERGPGCPDMMMGSGREQCGPMPHPRGRMGETTPFGPGMGPLRGGRRHSPQIEEIHKLERQAQELAKQYAQAEGSEKEELSEKLRKTLTETFELKLQMQAKQVEQLEKQLEKLREQLEKRQQNRQAIIEKRFARLTDQEDELAW